MLKIEWKCPKCGADANEHGRGGSEKCQDRHGRGLTCAGFICECDGDTEDDHGQTFTDVCSNAVCYHCGWCGDFPVKPKKLQTWEKKALEAGWTPPEGRRGELGLK